MNSKWGQCAWSDTQSAEVTDWKDQTTKQMADRGRSHTETQIPIETETQVFCFPLSAYLSTVYPPYIFLYVLC